MSASLGIVVDGTPVGCETDDTVLVALARAGVMPPGCLCNAGDCPHCLATIDGLPHRRMCQTAAVEGMVVVTTPSRVHPPLPAPTDPTPVGHRTEHVDVVVIGGGESGTAEAQRLRAAGHEVALLEARAGSEALAVYDGPVVLARIGGEIVRLQCDEVVVATGAAEIQPVAPGNDLRGILTPRAAAEFVRRGVDLGRVVAIGGAPEGVECLMVDGPWCESRVTGASRRWSSSVPLATRCGSDATR